MKGNSMTVPQLNWLYLLKTFSVHNLFVTW